MTARPLEIGYYLPPAKRPHLEFSPQKRHLVIVSHYLTIRKIFQLRLLCKEWNGWLKGVWEKRVVQRFFPDLAMEEMREGLGVAIQRQLAILKALETPSVSREIVYYDAPLFANVAFPRYFPEISGIVRSPGNNQLLRFPPPEYPQNSIPVCLQLQGRIGYASDLSYEENFLLEINLIDRTKNIYKERLINLNFYSFDAITGEKLSRYEWRDPAGVMVHFWKIEKSDQCVVNMIYTAEPLPKKTKVVFDAFHTPAFETNIYLLDPEKKQILAGIGVGQGCLVTANKESCAVCYGKEIRFFDFRSLKNTSRFVFEYPPTKIRFSKRDLILLVKNSIFIFKRSIKKAQDLPFRNVVDFALQDRQLYMAHPDGNIEILDLDSHRKNQFQIGVVQPLTHLYISNSVLMAAETEENKILRLSFHNLINKKPLGAIAAEEKGYSYLWFQGRQITLRSEEEIAMFSW